MVGVMVTSFKRAYASTVVFSAPNPTAGHCRPRPPSETPGHSQASLAQFLVGSLLLSPGSWWPQGFVCAPQEIVSQSCGSTVIKFHWPPRPNSLGVPSPLCRIPRLVNLLWVLEIS